MSTPLKRRNSRGRSPRGKSPKSGSSSPPRSGSSPRKGAYKPGPIHTFYSTVIYPFMQLQVHGSRDGPKSLDDGLIRLKHVINFFKLLTLPYCLALCYQYENWSYGALTYTALHGSYGILWLLKDWYWFPDASWEQAVPWYGAVNSGLIVAGYWVAPYLLISEHMEVGIRIPTQRRMTISEMALVRDALL